MKRLLLCVAFFCCATLKAQEIYVVASAIFENTATSTTGTAFVALATDNAAFVRVFNNTGTTLDFRIYNAGKVFRVPTATQVTFRGITNSNQLSVKRDDNSNTQVNFDYIIER